MANPLPEYVKVRTFVYNLALQASDGNPKLPSENELCNLFSVSRITVRKALQALVKSRILLTRKGMGTFVHPDFMLNKQNSRCIGYLRYNGDLAVSHFSGLFADTIEMLGLKYELLFRSDMPNSEARLLETVRTLSGIVWDGYSPEKTADSEVAGKIAKTGIPFLVIAKEKTEYDTILLDPEQEADVVAEYARKNGHENILFVSDLGNLPYRDYLEANPTCPAIYRRLRKDGKVPRDSYCTPIQLNSRLQNRNFLKKYTLIYTRRTLVREVLDLLNKQDIRIPEDLSCLVFEESTSLLFHGRTPSFISCRESMKDHLLNWLQRRILQGDRSGTFFEKQVVRLHPGESVRNRLK